MEDHFTAVTNTFFSEIITRAFTQQQLSVLHLILRLSYGCGKSECILKHSDFQVCGIHPAHIREVLYSLILNGVLRKDPIVFAEEKQSAQFYRIALNPTIVEWTITRNHPIDSPLYHEVLSRNLHSPSYTVLDMPKPLIQQKSQKQQEHNLQNREVKQEENYLQNQEVITYINGKYLLTESVSNVPDSSLPDNELQSPKDSKDSKDSTKEEEQIHMSDTQNDVGRPCADEPTSPKKRRSSQVVPLLSMSSASQERWEKFLTFLSDGMETRPDFSPLDFAQYHPKTPYLVAIFLVARTEYAPTWRVRSRDLSGWFRAMDRLVDPEDKRGEGWVWEHVRAVIKAIFAEGERPSTPKEFKWGRVIQSVPNFREHFEQMTEEYFPNGMGGPVPVERRPSWEEVKHVWE